MKETVEIISVLWEGPFEISDFSKFNCTDEKAFDLYQVYGTHPIYGRSVLLYIGSTKRENQRIKDHYDSWMKYEFDSMQVFKGKIVSIPDETNETEKELVEKILVYYSAPAYNSNSIFDLDSIIKENQRLIVLNFGKAGQLPTEVSSLWYSTYDHLLEHNIINIK